MTSTSTPDEKQPFTPDYHLDESSYSSEGEMDECASEVTQAELKANAVNYQEPTATLAGSHQDRTAQPATEQDLETLKAVPVQRGVVVNTVSGYMQLGMTSTNIPDPQRCFSSESSESSESDESDEDSQPPVQFQEPSPWQLAYTAFDKIVIDYKTKLTADLVAKQQEYKDTIEASEKYLTHHFADKYLDLTKQFTAKQHELEAQQQATMQELKEHKAVMVSRDALIVKLHNDVSERDALVAKLHNDIAERDALFVKLHLQNEAKAPDSSVVSRQEQPAVVKRKKCEKADSGHYNTRGKEKA